MPVTRVAPEPKLPEPKAAPLKDDESAVTGAGDEAARAVRPTERVEPDLVLLLVVDGEEVEVGKFKYG